MAWAGVRALTMSTPAWLGSMTVLRIDAGVLGFTMLVMIVTGLGFGLVPAVGAWSTDLVTPSKPVAGSVGLGGRGTVQSVLVVTQIALTLVLLVGAGLLMKSFWQLQRTNLGMDPRQVLSLQTRLPAGRGFKMVGTKNGFTQLEVGLVPADVFERVRQRLQQVDGGRVGGRDERRAGRWSSDPGADRCRRGTLRRRRLHAPRRQLRVGHARLLFDIAHSRSEGPRVHGPGYAACPARRDRERDHGAAVLARPGSARPANRRVDRPGRAAATNRRRRRRHAGQPVVAGTVTRGVRAAPAGVFAIANAVQGRAGST